ncbi:hypothetical protein [uncultured Pseudodesulfovibrio sp.]|uniref:hypothetical protein n=1 Tax=uncultured Pseudodesulfovibrio sp. TaxID=2035858 RepID=UPI0029C961D1|nr:hypothetical protein [uncultured Pseudodesulfovibrio sp.]
MQLFKTYKGKAIPALLTFVFMIGIPALVALIVQYDYIKDIDRVSNERLTLYESTLKSALKKHEYLPFLISETEIVRNLLAGKDNAVEVNSFLEAASINSGSAAVYVINKDGIVIASSNWQNPQNFLGLNLSFRPYFKTQ